MNSNSSQNILANLVNGDDRTIRNTYSSVFPKVISFVKNNKGSYEDAEEIFQDALFQVITRAKIKGIEIKSSFEAYLFTVCKNLWYKELNKSKKEVRNDGVFELKASEDKTMEAILYQDRWDLFEEMLQKLSGNCAELLKDYFKKVPYSEIVKKFSYATENTAFQRVFKCKKRLTELIKNDPRYRDLV